MTFATLKNGAIGKQKERHLSTFFWAMGVAIAFFIIYIIKDQGYFLFYGDFNVQQIPFYKLAHEAVRSGKIGWSWTTDLGANFIGSYTFYLLGSPFFWLTLPFPTNWVPYLMGPLLILKFAFSALTAYMFIRRFTRTPEAARLGGLIYAFSGFSVYNIFFNHFHEAIVIFPLLLLSVELLITENRRGYFAIMVAIAAISNYFFFFGMVVFTVIYWVVRSLSGCYKLTVSRFLWFGFEAILGLLMAAAFLLPTMSAVLGNSRINELLIGWNGITYGKEQIYLNIFECFFFPPDLPARPVFFPDADVKWSSLGGWLPLFSMVGVFAFMQQKKGSWQRRVLGISIFMALVPILNSAFYMFNVAYYARWYYMPILIMSLVTAQSVEDTQISWKSPYKWVLGITLATTFVVGLFPNDRANPDETKTLTQVQTLKTYNYIFIVAAALVLAYFIFIGVMAAKGKKIRLIKPLTWGVVLLFIAVALTGVFLLLVDGDTTKLGLYTSSDDNTFFYRFLATSAIAIVSLIILGLLLTTIRKQRMQFILSATAIVCVISVIYSAYFIGTGKTHAYDSDIMIDDLIEANIKLPGDSDTYRIDVYDGVDNTGMYLGYGTINAFHSIVPYSVTDFWEYVGEERGVASRPTVGSVAARSLLGVKYLLARKSGESFIDENGYTRMAGFEECGTVKGYTVYENKNYVPLGFTYDYYVTKAQSDNTADIQRSNLMLKAMLLTDKQVAKYGGLMDNIANLNPLGEGYEDIIYSFYYSDEEIAEDAKNLRNSAISGFKRTKSGFESSITMDKNNLVFFSIPYDEGWSATVNGKAVEIEQVNVGFMAVYAPKGTNKIVFTYETPGLKTGLMVSFGAFIVFLGYILIFFILQKMGKTASCQYPEGELMLEKFKKDIAADCLAESEDLVNDEIAIETIYGEENESRFERGFWINTDMTDDFELTDLIADESDVKTEKPENLPPEVQENEKDAEDIYISDLIPEMPKEGEEPQQES